MDISNRILGVLFYSTEPITRDTLASMLAVEREVLDKGIEELQSDFASRGIRTLTEGDTVALVTAPELAETIDTIRKDALSRDIGKAGAETLAIVVYHGRVSRARIDAIRGVQSSAIVRSLLVRGLIERIAGEGRSPEYAASPQLLAHLGVTNRGELADFHEVMSALTSFTEDLEKKQS
ncbi:hypothetical protein A3C87_02280 [Candidatus Kaiserbacteria bacterium RIFCSPHIGHO2_02_FULL_49_34]|uniref:SMC-Scp complex subunit ScpB n=1 Tax=Candidatus Kaiserbacteria bacterium RIFCSPHIGHO2_02_FULL_49_34 TaxID=1798491 RepID=A0A1F6DN08_9BACT|nr:MAG: hypothetical protein A3C87_02280 [Candidatus Kaiserbacteria bacterium RIFCSPHIGHO2_02_FULL_49_34]